MISSVPIAMLVALLSAGISWLHLVHTADRIASSFGGYFISIGVLPVIWGACLGLCGIRLLHQSLSPSLVKYWWLPVLGLTFALIPVGFVLFVSSQLWNW